MSRIGYARVSTKKQDAEGQVKRLIEAGCDPQHMFIDHGAKGKLASRPEWDKCRQYLRKGDVLVCVRLDRPGRSARHLLEMSDWLKAEGIDIVCLDQPVDTTTAIGKCFFTVLAAFAEFEHDLIVDRTMDGLKAAWADGAKSGRKPKMSPEDAELAQGLYDRHGPAGDRTKTVAQIAAHFKVDRTTLYRYLGREKVKAS